MVPCPLTGSTDFHESPVRIDALHDHEICVVQLAAAKYHSAAVDASGKLYTWGWGRGGRLGASWLGFLYCLWFWECLRTSTSSWIPYVGAWAAGQVHFH